jgi:hypothetical protein
MSPSRARSTYNRSIAGSYHLNTQWPANNPVNIPLVSASIPVGLLDNAFHMVAPEIEPGSSGLVARDSAH